MTRKRWLLYSGILFLVFIIFTVLIKTVDVQTIGPENSSVGFATLNGAFRDWIGSRIIWYEITQFVGYISFCTCIVFAAIGFYQMVRRRSILRVDYPILALGAFYVVVLLVYILFDFVLSINFRPIIIDAAKGLERSYPSSHTILACTLFGSTYIVARTYIRRRTYRLLMAAGSAALAAFIIIGRIISGVHWLTDVIGAVLLSSSLLCLFLAFYRPGLLPWPIAKKDKTQPEKNDQTATDDPAPEDADPKTES
ncbi:MAG: phosphatase PAP2 family protein [Clostridia bacterium]|nr:phosphatase PAP2 family protein [Clostridia bacterium]